MSATSSAALSLFATIFAETPDCQNYNQAAAIAIEDSLHQLYLKSEEDGTYWVGACQALTEIRFQVVTPYQGICRIRDREIVYVRYDTDAETVEIEQLGIDGEVYGVERKYWDMRLTDKFVLLPGGIIYGSEEEAKAGLAVRRK